MRRMGGRQLAVGRWGIVLAVVALSACGARSPLGDRGRGPTGTGGESRSGGMGAPGTGGSGSGGAIGDAGAVTDAVVATDADTCSVRRAPAGPFAFLSAGNEGTCGIRTDGTLACWGDTYSYSLPEPFPGTYTHVSKHLGVCAVQTTGALSCWGAADSNLMPVPTGAFAEVAITESGACARRADQSVICWGMGPNVPAGVAFASLTAGADYVCGLEAAGHAAVCWEPRYKGEGTIAKSGPFVAVDTGRFFACGLRPDGNVSCWPASVVPGLSDSNQYGQLSPPPGPFVELTVGEMHACGRRADGQVTCWGADTYGESTPPRGLTFTHVSAGSYHSCGIRPDASVVCWGGLCPPWG